MTLTTMQSIVAAAFTKAGLDPAFGLGIAKQESGFDPNTSVVTGGDAARGGSYGLGCMSLKTALNLDRSATIARLHNPQYNAYLMAELCLENWRRACTRDPAELASRYNSGKPFHLAPDSTRLVYVPHVLRYMAEFRAMLSAPAEASDSAAAPAAHIPLPVQA